MIKIVDYKAGNAPSVLHAVTRLGYTAELARTPEDIANASHIILPGVGSARATMQSLCETGIAGALESAVLHRGVWFLGICVGMQILFEHSEEENTDCLGWLNGSVIKFDTARVRVPQMGWNQVDFVKNTPVCTQSDYFYFVNSYYAKPKDEADTWGISDYNGPFTAAVCKRNIYATQFHMEKSGEAGLSMLTGFLRLKGDL